MVNIYKVWPSNQHGLEAEAVDRGRTDEVSALTLGYFRHIVNKALQGFVYLTRRRTLRHIHEPIAEKSLLSIQIPLIHLKLSNSAILPHGLRFLRRPHVNIPFHIPRCNHNHAIRRTRLLPRGGETFEAPTFCLFGLWPSNCSYVYNPN